MLQEYIFWCSECTNSGKRRLRWSHQQKNFLLPPGRRRRRHDDIVFKSSFAPLSILHAPQFFGTSITLTLCKLMIYLIIFVCLDLFLLFSFKFSPRNIESMKCVEQVSKKLCMIVQGGWHVHYMTKGRWWCDGRADVCQKFFNRNLSFEKWCIEMCAFLY